MWLGLAETLHRHTVEQHLVGSTQVAARQVRRLGGHRATPIQPVADPAQHRRDVLVGGGSSSGVERGHQRGALGHQGREGGSRHQRLVHVQDVEPLIPQHRVAALERRDVEGDRGERAVRGDEQRVADGDDVRLGRRTVARPQQAHRHAAAAQGTCQVQGLHLHAAGKGETVGADHPHAHGTHASGSMDRPTLPLKRGTLPRPRDRSASWVASGATAWDRGGSCSPACGPAPGWPRRRRGAGDPPG